MGKFVKTGRVIFATGIIALAVICFILKDFIVGRPPAWPVGVALNPMLSYVSATIIIIASVAILFNTRGLLASITIAVLVFLLSVLRHLFHYLGDWPNTYKSIALVGGALIVAASFYKEKRSIVARVGFRKDESKGLILAGCLLLASFFFASGYAHFKFAAFVIDFIPAYLPFHTFWTYFCGICLIAGGIGILIPSTRRVAALLSGLMIAGWFVLLHVPRFIANTKDISDRMGLCESFTFVGIFFVLTGIASARR